MTTPASRRLALAPATGFEPLSPAESDAHLHAATAAEGIAAVLRARGHRVLAEDMARHGGVADTTMLLVAHADTLTLFNTLPVQATHENAWTRTASRPSRRQSGVNDALKYLDAHSVDGDPLTGYLTGQAWANVPDLPNTRALIETTRAAALTGWWADRMDEGHSAGPDGSAALLLGLLLPAALIRRIAYDDYDPDEAAERMLVALGSPITLFPAALT